MQAPTPGIAILVGTLLFSGLTKASDHTLLSLVVLVLVAYAFYFLYPGRETVPAAAAVNTITRKESAFAGSLVLPPQIPKHFKYLHENQDFIDITKDIRVVRQFDTPKWEDIVTLFDALQKIYIYILANRYDPVTHIPRFMDTRQALLEHMYSLVFTLPEQFEHIYGIRPYELIDRNIQRTLDITRTMAEVLKSYAVKTKGAPYIPESAKLPIPYDAFGSPTQRLP